MTTYVAENARPSQPSVTPYEANDLVSVRCSLPIGTAALAVGDTLELGKLPQGCVLTALKFDSDQLDSGAALAFSFGTLTGAPGDAVNARTNNAEFGTGITTVGRAAGEATYLNPRIPRLPPQPVERGIGLTVTAAAGTAVVQPALTGANRGAWRKNATYALNDYVLIPGGAYMVATTAGQSQSGVDQTGAASATSPNWNITFNGNTQDGSVVWTCVSPTIGLTMTYRPSRNLY